MSKSVPNNKKSPEDFTPKLTATVISVTRRNLAIKLPDNTITPAKSAKRSLEFMVGDQVNYFITSGEYCANEILPRRNFLRRQYGTAEKSLVSNIDHLFIVTAIGPLFNNTFIDRAILAANEQSIDCTLLINKIDLDPESTFEMVNVYKKIGIRIHELSCKKALGLEGLKEILEDQKLGWVALTGVSGVGKSSLINSLIPGTGTRTNEVSEKTGQGKQTTTLAYAHSYTKKSGQELMVVDLQGFSNFGLTHLDKNSVQYGFKEIFDFSARCKYSNCMHLNEHNCGVKDALSAGNISQIRYDSYKAVIEEIERVAQY